MEAGSGRACVWVTGDYDQRRCARYGVVDCVRVGMLFITFHLKPNGHVLFDPRLR